MSVFERYEQAIQRGDIEACAAQRDVVMALEALEQNLCRKRRMFSFSRMAHPLGVYLYGEVGAGKTYLMDLFYHAVNIRDKTRVHFHQFMQQIDAQLRRLQGHIDPLRLIVKDMAKTTRLLCIDEFLVHDVAHAMMLAELLDAFVREGVVMVMTSNTAPDDLYRNGIQRARFLPAIALIKSHCHVLELSSPRDFRLGKPIDINPFMAPVTLENTQQFARQFTLLEPHPQGGGDINIQHRRISCINRGENAIWFEFNTLCRMPRSQLDYLELSERYRIFFLSHVPLFCKADTVEEYLFIQLIDVLYDKHIRLLMLAHAPLGELADMSFMTAAFARTMSRLQEMQSHDYGRH